MERLMRWREPAAVVALVTLGLQLVLVVGLAIVSGAPIEVGGLPLAAYLVDPALLVLLTALVIACWVVEPTPHARAVTLAGLVLTAGALVAATGLVIAGLDSVPSGGVLVPLVVRLVPSLAAAVIALGTLLTLLRRPLPAAAPMPELEPAEPEPEPLDPQQQPTWTSDAAVGTVWRRAGDAGLERPATSWDAPAADGGGWGSDPDTDGPVEPTRRTTD